MIKETKGQQLAGNNSLKPLDILIGEWETTASHPFFAGKTFHGHCSFKWIENGAFILMQSTIVEEGIPNSTTVFGSDDHADMFFMLYFDERGVSRKYETKLENALWTIWRDDPGFAQRFTGSIIDNNDKIIGVWELCKDGTNWDRDLEITYTRRSKSI